MTRPTLSVSADFGAGFVALTAAKPKSTTGTEVGREGLVITRGSTSQSMTGFVADASTLQTTLDNINRDFDPNYSAGPYFGDLLPGVPVLADIDWDGLHQTFLGGADGWPQQFPNHGTDQLVTLQATDALGQLANMAVDLRRPAERTGERILAVLAALGYPGAVDIDPGRSYMPALKRGTSVSLSHIVDCVQVEWGELYVEAEGDLRFRDRDSIATDTNSSVSQATFVQSGGLNFADITLVELKPINEVVISWSDSGKQVTVRDQTSVDAYGLRSISPSLPMMTGSQARSYARWLLLLYANPVTTFSSIRLEPGNEPGATFDLWEQALTRELGDRITITADPLHLDAVTKRPELSGEPITRDCVIRGITQDFSSDPWSVTFSLQDQTWMDTLFIWDTSELDGPDIYGM